MSKYLVCPAFTIKFDTGIKVEANSAKEAKQKVWDMWSAYGTLTLHSMDYDTDLPLEDSTGAVFMKVNGKVVKCLDDYATIEYDSENTYAQEA